MMIFDLPYGILKEAWDEKVYDQKELETLLDGFRAVQAKAAWFVLLWCNQLDTSPVVKALRNRDYTDIYLLYWYKKDHIAVGRTDRHVNAVEVCVTARFTGGMQGALECFMSSNPAHRDNLLTAKSDGLFLLNDKKEKVNVCQKPFAIYEKILPLYLKTGAKILIGGFGAGGEINACIQLGYDCIAFETDKVQFDEVSRWLRTYDAWKGDVQEKLQKTAARKEKADAAALAAQPTQPDPTFSCSICGTFAETELDPCVVCQKPVCDRTDCRHDSEKGRTCKACKKPPTTPPTSPAKKAKPAAEDHAVSPSL